MLVTKLRDYIPRRLYDYARRAYFARQNFRFQRNVQVTTMKIAGIDVDIPSNHLLLGVIASQPRRDLPLADAAELVGAKYPERTIIDIGANIGDTACILASKCTSQLVLVEGSDFFFPYLSENAKKLKNVTTLHHCLVGDGDMHNGDLAHWGGTAHFVENNESPSIPTKTLAELATDFCMVKVDTDGWDYFILMSSIQTIAELKPTIVFENHIRTEEDLTVSNQLYDKLCSIGYHGFCVFDEQGYLIISTLCRKQLTQLNRFMYLQYSEDAHRKSFWNYDVYCFHERDLDIYRGFSRRFE